MLQVADLQLDLRYRHVITPEQTAELPQRVFDVLLILLSQPHVLHSRSALLEQVWSGVVVEDANLSQAIWTLRKALGSTRKPWIRTVAKGGYVFDPPAPVQAIPIESLATDILPAPPVPASTSTTLVVEAPVGPAPTPLAAEAPGFASGARPGHAATGGVPAARPRPRIQLGWLAVASAAGLMLLVALLGLARLGGQPTQLPPLQPVAVALMEVGNGEDSDARWPATVLHAWLEWKLNALPEVTLLTEAHLAADATQNSPQVVLLSAGKSADQPEERFIRARFDAPGGTRQLELRGSAAQMPGLIDTLSRQVLEELVPARRDDPWPSLEMGEPAMRSYAAAYQAYSSRDMASAAAGLAAVLQQAPQFGLAHLQMAMAQYRLGQARLAMEHVAHAARLLTPVSADVASVLAAAALSVDPQRANETAVAYAELAARYPQRISFRLEQAWHEMRGGDPDAALLALDGTQWQRQPLGVQIQWRLTLAEIEGVRLDSDAVLEHATQAAQLARDAGKGWERELAAATLLQARVHAFQRGPEAGQEGFAEAARLFASVGAEIDALHARVSGELMLPTAGRSKELDTLLAHARAGGYRNLEIQLLRGVAFQQRSAGNLGEYRRRLKDALAIAESVGDVSAQQELQVDLLNEDLLLGRFERATERIRQIRAGPLTGDTATWLDQFEGFVHGIRGDYPAASQALDQTVDRLAREGDPPLPADALARLACARAELLLTQGRLQDARARRAQCADTRQAYLGNYALTVGAMIDLMAGDAGNAAPALQERVSDIQAMPPSPERWAAALWTAYLLARAEDLDTAHTLYTQTLAALQDTGYEWLIADAEIGLGEIAVARGHFSEATRLSAAARQRLPGASWQQFHRLDQIGVVVAFANGQNDEAQSRLIASDARAHEVGDIKAQLELHSLMDALGPYLRPDARGCDPVARNALLAGTGMRGANLDWMLRDLPLPDAQLAMTAWHTDH
ncbi:winged helix-turn-helix domain-containing protein [Lysobacter ciconiae]|uniref:Winged helix-turn-helix domain-containing protein n=1 Tax=Novilysobacter ciconiae TaxID=2781022 RepID=A0A7S6UG91_9GAMM|nr:winged helix-turn-helix domain-containing protein [Lysobacter ciconiae]QOW19736.1 winged helix-turn-helix domain-containing protein [Lysobacter ciconiae]